MELECMHPLGIDLRNPFPGNESKEQHLETIEMLKWTEPRLLEKEMMKWSDYKHDHVALERALRYKRHEHGNYTPPESDYSEDNQKMDN